MLDLEKCLNELKRKRKLFVSEADFQLELAWVIKELYPDCRIRMEYPLPFDLSMHVDIWVMMKDGVIPIELKYKTKGCRKIVYDELYILKNHGAKDVNLYLYLKDIERVERIKKNIDNYIEGYTVFMTNDLSYTKKPLNDECIYKDFSLEEGNVKSGRLDWGKDAGEGTKRGCEKPIELNGSYRINWKDYSIIDNTNTGRFVYLLNKV